MSFIFSALPDNPKVKWDKKLIAESVRDLVDNQEISVVMNLCYIMFVINDFRKVAEWQYFSH